MSTMNRRPMSVSPLWLQAAILTLIFGFAILGYATIRVYRDSAPGPGRITDEGGHTLFTRADILQGQEHFLTYGLMGQVTVHPDHFTSNQTPRNNIYN